MSDPYSQGGGGGRSGTLTSSSQYALNQPYEIGFPVTAAEVAKLNESLRVLFKNVTLAKQTIASAGSGDVTGPSSSTANDLALFSTTTGKVLLDGGRATRMVDVNLSNSQLAALSSSPVYMLVAQGAGVVIVPTMLEIEVISSAAYTSSPSWQLQYQGIAGINIVSATTSDLNNNRNKHYVLPVIAQTATGTNSAISNKGVQISFSADPTGAGTMTAVVTMTYYLRTGSGL